MEVTAAPKAVIFDMDGLMVDSEPVWEQAWRISLKRQGYELKAGFREALTGASRPRALQITHEFYGEGEAADKAFEDHYTVAEQLFIESGAPKKRGLDELLALLEEKGIPAAVASSTARPSVEAILRHAGIFERFSAIKTGDQGFASKPAPDIFLAAAADLGVSPADAWVLEDSPAGIQAALAGGFVPFMVPDLVQPDDELRQRVTVCDSLLDVEKTLEGLTA